MKKRRNNISIKNPLNSIRISLVFFYHDPLDKDGALFLFRKLLNINQEKTN